MFVAPISHEHHQARRWPIATLVIIAINVLVFLFTFVERPVERTLESAAAKVQEYQAEHPYLKINCQGTGDVTSPSERPTSVTSEEEAAEQAALDELCVDYDSKASGLIRQRYGDIPARGGFITLFTYQFIHAGILHIVFNVWFLWLCGANLEDRWGRAIFVAFYLVSGMVAALVHRATAAGSWGPLVGASGAIAGAMGAFLVIYAATRITFFYAYFITKPKWGTFGAPAYVMLPLWLSSELFDGLIGTADGTSHWAHVGGFAFGALVGLVMKYSGADQRLDAMNELAVSTGQDPRLVAAMELTDQGRSQEALAALGHLAHEDPKNIDVALETLRAATALRDTHRRVNAYLRLIELYVESGSVDTAAELWSELRAHGLEGVIPRAERLRIGELFARKSSRFDVVILCAASAHADGLLDPVALRGAVLHATMLVRAQRLGEARALLAEARLSPFSSPELDSKIQAQLQIIERRVGESMAGPGSSA